MAAVAFALQRAVWVRQLDEWPASTNHGTYMSVIKSGIQGRCVSKFRHQLGMQRCKGAEQESNTANSPPSIILPRIEIRWHISIADEVDVRSKPLCGIGSSSQQRSVERCHGGQAVRDGVATGSEPYDSNGSNGRVGRARRRGSLGRRVVSIARVRHAVDWKVGAQLPNECAVAGAVELDGAEAVVVCSTSSTTQ